jgi:hypothetical protein
MNWKKVRKISLITLGILGIVLGGIYLFAWYTFTKKYIPSKNRYEHRIAHIDPNNSMLSDGFETCHEYIYDYYNPERPTYVNGKNGLRKFVLKNYKNDGYSDSGYLNIRFVINCKGETGRYVIHENDLSLSPKKFNPEIKKQLFELTTQLNKWNPNFIRGKKVDSYMYISYRIENGEIIEIIP